MKTKLILLLAINAILLSCGREVKNKETAQIETAFTQAKPKDNTTSIELNNGQQWKVDERMMTHIRNMEKDIFIFSKSGQKDYKSLADKLQTNLDLLTSGCTMEGRAHDELRKWLLPFMDLVKDFSSTKGDDFAVNQFEKIQSSFITFNHYFN